MQRKSSIKILSGLMIAVILFHIAVVARIIPYEIAWGGRLQNDQEMYVFEAISILINLFLILVLLMKGSYIKLKLPPKIINGILWGFFVLFALNTIGNMFAKTTFEKSFAVVTCISAWLIWKILKPKPNPPTTRN